MGQLKINRQEGRQFFFEHATQPQKRKKRENYGKLKLELHAPEGTVLAGQRR